MPDEDTQTTPELESPHQDVNDYGTIDSELNTLNTKQKLVIDADAVEAPELFDAFIAGYDAANPSSDDIDPANMSEETIKSELEPQFVAWLEEYAPGVFV